MNITVTGHRPDKLGGYTQAVGDHLYLVALAVLEETQPKKVMLGMAQGWDQAIARACVTKGIPWCAAIPFQGQESIWPAAAQAEYRRLLGQASAIKCISPGGYEVAKMHRRNEYMAEWARDQEDGHCVALWNHTPGGTASMVAYCHKINLPVFNAWDIWTSQARYLKVLPRVKWKGPLPQINVSGCEGSDYDYKITYKGVELHTGSASRHGTALAAAQRNREWIMDELLAGTRSDWPKVGKGNG